MAEKLKVLGVRGAMLLAQINYDDLEKIGNAAALSFILGMLFCTTAVFFLYFIGWWLTNRSGSVSPYTGEPMVLGEEFSFQAVQKIHLFMESVSSKENEIFAINKAAVCRQTGRVFPNCVGLFQIVKLKWNFLNKYYPGNYVSWGSLSSSQKDEIFACHDHLDGYQTEFSSSQKWPKDVESFYLKKVPGPLYVDLEKKVLLGWKCVPGTDLEVLLVQLPKNG